MKKYLPTFALLLLFPFLLFSKNNSLVSSAGTMNLDPINLCLGQTVIVPHNGDEILDPDDIIRVVLHDNSGTTLGNITGVQLPINATLSSILSGISFGTTYYISAIAGIDDGTGNVDLTDPELSVAQGTPIVFLDLLESNMNVVICEGESIVYSGTTYTSSGVYAINLISVNGCDSTVYLTVIVAAQQTTVLAETICEGEVYILGGTTCFATGFYSVNLLSSQGCDSTVTLNLTVLNPQAGIFPVTEMIDCSGIWVEVNAVVVDPNPSIIYNWSGQCIDPGVLGSPNIQVHCAGTYTLQVEQTNNGVTCFSDIITTTVLTDTIAPVVDAGPDQNITCTNSSIELFGTATPPSGNYAYSWVGPGYTGTEQTALISIPGEYCFLAIDLTNSCVSNTDCVMVFGDATIPTAVTNVSGNLDCINSSVVISGAGSSTGSNIIYQWYVGGSVLPGETSLTLNVTTAGDYMLEVTDTNTGCSNLSEITVLEDVTSPNVSVSVNGTISCIIGSVTLDGSGSSTGGNFTYLWSDGTSSLQTNVSAPGTYTLIVVNNITGCTASQSVVVTEDITPPVADAGSDMILNCGSSEVVLDGTGSSVGVDLNYIWTTTDGNIVSGEGTLGLIVNAEGTYELLVTNLTNGCTSVDQVIVSIGLPIDLGEDTYFDCNLTEMAIVGNLIPTGLNYIYTWTTNDGMIASGADTPSPIISSPGTYVLNINDPLNNCSNSDEITVYYFNDVVVVNENMNLNCDPQLPNVLDASLQLSNLNLSYLWTTINGSFVGPIDILNPTVDAIGTYDLTVIDNSTGCTATAAIVMGDMILPTAVIEIIGMAVIDCNNASIILDGFGSTPITTLSFEWFTNGSIVSSITSVEAVTAGIYELVVTDQNGCSNMTQIEITDNTDEPIFTIPVGVGLNCNNNFTEEVGVVLADPNLNISYEWTDPNGIVISTDSSFIFTQDEAVGNYDVTITNLNNGCTSAGNIFLSFDGFDIDVATIAAGCDLEDGMATATTILSNSFVEWNTGEQGGTISGLAQGWYSVTVTDTDNNCSRHKNFFIDEDISCKVVISGYVLEDPNNTCTYDANLTPVECVMVKLDPLGIYTMTDATGYYEFIVDEGSYTVEYVGSAEVDLQCPLPGIYDMTLSTNGSISADNHFYVVRPDFDLCITKSTGNARPGFNQFNCVQICNYGDENADGVVTFIHDGLFLNQTPWPNISPAYGNTIASTYSYDEATNTFTWNIDDLPPGDCRKIMWWMPVPLTAMIGDVIFSEAKVNPIVDDVNPANNCLAWSQTIRGSYDPNDKRNFIGESEWGGPFYDQDETMDYAIRFQNVGTDTAFTVVVRDTLDSEYLDVTTIRGFTASHYMNVQFEDSNVLVFTFNNILLVDSTTNEPASNGWLNFNIDLKPNLPLNTEIRNQAAIYFDFNAPVITNEVVDLFTNEVSVFSPKENTLQVEITPTITTDEIRVYYVLEKTNTVSMQVYNVGGVLLRDIDFGKKATGEHVENLSLKDFRAGVYFVFVKTEEGSAVRRVVKM